MTIFKLHVLGQAGKLPMRKIGLLVMAGLFTASFSVIAPIATSNEAFAQDTNALRDDRRSTTRSHRANNATYDSVEGFRAKTRSVTPYIVGGGPAPDRAYPWQVGLVFEGKSPSVGTECGGSLIEKNWVLTARHCFDGRSSSSKITIYEGSNSLIGNGQQIEVEEPIMHPDLDVALLKLKKPASDNSTPVKRVRKDEESSLANPGVLATVTGWGATRERGNGALTLQEVDVVIVSNGECNSPRSYNGRVQSTEMCAGFREGGKDSCQGDSGGPLVVPDKRGGFSLAGVVSWGEGCARPFMYGVYVRTSAINRWIDGKIN